MRKLVLLLAIAACFLAVPLGVQAYTFTDPVPDAIGVPTFETYGMNVYNFTPGSNSGAITIELFSNYPAGGLLVSDWQTYAADLFIDEYWMGNWYKWAIPLVSHDSFTAGVMYAVGSFKVSDDFAPPAGGYVYNHNVPVRIDSVGNNYGYSSFGGGSVAWTSLVPPGSPDWKITITTGIYEDDLNGKMSFLWGTATCANDVITGTVPVPEPTSLLLLGFGLLGVCGVRTGLRKF